MLEDEIVSANEIGRNGTRRVNKTNTKQSVTINEDIVNAFTIIPRMGRTKAVELIKAGLVSLSDLDKIPLEDLARIKWIGDIQARIIKEWLSQHQDLINKQPSKKTKALLTGPQKEIRELPDVKKVKEIPAPADIPMLTHQHDGAPVEVNDPIPQINNRAIHNEISQVETAISLIKKSIPKSRRNKSFMAQLKKTYATINDVVKKYDSLHDRERLSATKILDRITMLLNNTVQEGKITGKKQLKIKVKLIQQRKKIKKVLDK